ncbi:MAG: response regulator [Candidatus Kariarchaeaceae archaeon]
MRILLVDDEKSLLELGEIFLNREEPLLKITSKESANQAIIALKEENYDIIVSDYKMPEINGIEFLKLIREANIEIPFILFTMHGREQVAMEALNEGAQRYIQKGVDIQAQFRVLKQAIINEVNNWKNQKLLEESEKFLSLMFDSIQDGISILDKDLNIIKVNETMNRWYSSQVPLVGKKCYAAYQGRNIPCEDCPTLETLETGKKALVSKSSKMIDHEIWFDLYTFPMKDSETGEIVGIIEYVRNMTDQKIAERELVKGEKMYRTLFNILSEGIIYLSYEEGKSIFQDVNEEACIMLGYSKEEFLNLSFKDMSDYSEDRINAFYHGLSTQPRMRFEASLKHKNGSAVRVEISSTQFTLEGKKIIVVILRDVKSKYTRLE